ncbi:hypothetical protein [Amycolatopsis sp. NPDC004378]
MIPGFTEWLETLTDDELRHFISRTLPEMNKAAQAEFGVRLELLRVAPRPAPTPAPAPVRHGTGCPPGCCGVGVRQWR